METIKIQEAQNTGRIKLYKPEDKQVTSSDITFTEISDDWCCELVNPDHSALKKKASANPFKNKNANWHERESEMIQLMKDNIGMGLACPQIGQSYNMFVMIHSHLKEIGVYNPQILETEGEVNLEEGCLTWPLLFFNVRRPERIKVRYTKTDGETDVEMWMDGMDARCFLHEYDHLQGTVFLEYAGDVKLRRAMEKRNKLLEKARRRFKR